jgi:hypothetical protein
MNTVGGRPACPTAERASQVISRGNLFSKRERHITALEAAMKSRRPAKWVFCPPQREPTQIRWWGFFVVITQPKPNSRVTLSAPCQVVPLIGGETFVGRGSFLLKRVLLGTGLVFAGFVLAGLQDRLSRVLPPQTRPMGASQPTARRSRRTTRIPASCMRGSGSTEAARDPRVVVGSPGSQARPRRGTLVVERSFKSP